MVKCRHRLSTITGIFYHLIFGTYLLVCLVCENIFAKQEFDFHCWSVRLCLLISIYCLEENNVLKSLSMFHGITKVNGKRTLHRKSQLKAIDPLQGMITVQMNNNDYDVLTWCYIILQQSIGSTRFIEKLHGKHSLHCNEWLMFINQSGFHFVLDMLIISY